MAADGGGNLKLAANPVIIRTLFASWGQLNGDPFDGEQATKEDENGVGFQLSGPGE